MDLGLRSCHGRHELARFYRRMGDAGHCAAVLREVAAAHPDYLPARVELVEVLCALGEAGEARAVLAAIPATATLQDELARLWARVEGNNGAAARPA